MRIVIVGDGKVGLTLTQMLTAEDNDVTVVDSNSKVLERMQDEYDAMAVHGHGASRTVLAEAQAGQADVVIAATSSDEVNLLSCLISRKMGCKTTIARVRDPVYTDDIELLQEELGLSFAINPEEACAREIFRLLQIPSFLDREVFAKGRVEIVRFIVGEGSPLVNVSLAEMHGTIKEKALVCAVDRNGEVTIPHGDFVLREGDDIFVAAAAVDLAALIRHLGLATHKVTQVTIVGGSRLALYLATMLLNSNVGVKIIERDEGRSLLLSEELSEADIVCADGTEQDVLRAEGVGRSDALVALTGIDEENIVLSMYARQIGVPITITKCNRNQYADMFRKMDIDTVVSPKQNCAEEIVRYVRAMAGSAEGAMVALHQIANGKADAMEFKAEAGCRMLGIPLKDLKLADGVLIASISRGRRTVIPKGDSIVEQGDSVVVVATAGRHINDLNDIVEA